MAQPARPFWEGVRDVAPLLPGVLPFAVITGATALEAGLSPETAVAMAVGIFAGASQLATVQLVEAGAVPWVVVATALLINLRFVMYSASLAPHLAHMPPLRRWPLAYLLTDQAYALSMARFHHRPGEPDGHKPWYYLGTAVTMWIAWLMGNLGGIAFGGRVPAGLSLQFAIPLTFLALLVPLLRDRPTVVAAVVGGAVAVAGAGLPFNLGLVLGGVSGICAALLAENLRPDPSAS
ncbi:AzlC family ABC transporter permease [Thiohalorhabdus sp. Cl-TMA]|uniref:AzlC family ABC transporter permease n=1 Tax=Thiohalorhabdus methylotrophus TaxID=3242694 RepID=A0ABV4TQI1_9GAMM